ncbi:hypothetical protein BH18ACI4_BH18ACI4_13100 [soil metagenome]
MREEAARWSAATCRSFPTWDGVQPKAATGPRRGLFGQYRQVYFLRVTKLQKKAILNEYYQVGPELST